MLHHRIAPSLSLPLVFNPSPARPHVARRNLRVYRLLLLLVELINSSAGQLDAGRRIEPIQSELHELKTVFAQSRIAQDRLQLLARVDRSMVFGRYPRSECLREAAVVVDCDLVVRSFRPVNEAFDGVTVVVDQEAGGELGMFP
jgi:hypothetical protein